MPNASLPQVCEDNCVMYALMLLALLDLLLLEFALNSQVSYYAVWVATELGQAAGGIYPGALCFTIHGWLPAQSDIDKIY